VRRCACGCGAEITSTRISPSTGRLVQYRPGHNARGTGRFGPSQREPGYHKRWRDANPGKVRQYYLKTRYGMTPEQYDTLYAEQGGACAICREQKRLVVDHDHETGAVRGLLCDLCNTGIGKLRDSAERLRAAAVYLENDDGARTGRMSSGAAKE